MRSPIQLHWPHPKRPARLSFQLDPSLKEKDLRIPTSRSLIRSQTQSIKPRASPTPTHLFFKLLLQKRHYILAKLWIWPRIELAFNKTTLSSELSKLLQGKEMLMDSALQHCIILLFFIYNIYSYFRSHISELQEVNHPFTVYSVLVTLGKALWS